MENKKAKDKDVKDKDVKVKEVKDKEVKDKEVKDKEVKDKEAKNKEVKNNKAEDIFKQGGLKKTLGRSAVLEILSSSEKPLTYDEVFLALINKTISINISTVYRILETFVDKGIVSKLNGGENNRSLYELARSEHRHYFFCVNCRELYPINTCPLRSFVEDLKTKQFEVFDHKLEVYGVCGECKVH